MQARNHQFPQSNRSSRPNSTHGRPTSSNQWNSSGIQQSSYQQPDKRGSAPIRNPVSPVSARRTSSNPSQVGLPSPIETNQYTRTGSFVSPVYTDQYEVQSPTSSRTGSTRFSQGAPIQSSRFKAASGASEINKYSTADIHSYEKKPWSYGSSSYNDAYNSRPTSTVRDSFPEQPALQRGSLHGEEPERRARQSRGSRISAISDQRPMSARSSNVSRPPNAMPLDDSRGGVSASQKYQRPNPGMSSGYSAAAIQPASIGRDEATTIDELINMIAQNVLGLESIHKQALSSINTSESARKIDASQDKINRMIRDARQKLQRMVLKTKEMVIQSQHDQAKVRKLNQTALAKKLMNAAQRYQQIQQSYKTQCQDRITREIRIARPNATREEVQQVLDSNNGQVFAQVLLSTEIAGERRALEEVQGRHQELVKLEESIDQLAQLFQDMQIIIDTQQETLDLIDTQVEKSYHYVESGSRELSQAIHYREASRKKAWIAFFLIVFILIVLSIIIYVNRCAWLKADCPTH